MAVAHSYYYELLIPCIHSPVMLATWLGMSRVLCSRSFRRRARWTPLVPWSTWRNCRREDDTSRTSGARSLGYFIRVLFLPNDNFSLDLRQPLVRYLLYMQFNTVYELKWYVTFEDVASKLKLYCKYSGLCLIFQLLFMCLGMCISISNLQLIILAIVLNRMSIANGWEYNTTNNQNYRSIYQFSL